AVLPAFSPYQTRPTQYIEVFNRGTVPFAYTARPAVPWVHVTPSSGRVDKEVRLEVKVDWARAPKGRTEGPITVSGPNGARVDVIAVGENPEAPRGGPKGFIEASGYVSIEGHNHSRAVNGKGVQWRLIPDIGKTRHGMTPWPQTAASVTPGGNSPRLEYTVTLFTAGEVKVTAHL